MKKNQNSFFFATGVVKARESRLIGSSRWRTLAEMNWSDLASALKDCLESPESSIISFLSRRSILCKASLGAFVPAFMFICPLFSIFNV